MRVSRREGWDTQVSAARRTLGRRHPYATILWDSRIGLFATLALPSVLVLSFVYRAAIAAFTIHVWGLLLTYLVPVLLIAGGSALFGIVCFALWWHQGWILKSYGWTPTLYTGVCVLVFLLAFLILGVLL